MSKVPDRNRDLVPLRMLKRSGNLNAGEIAGFEPHIANKMVANGSACRHEGEPRLPLATRPVAKPEKDGEPKPE